MPRNRSKLRVISALTLVATTAFVVSCKEEDKDTRLFDEDGVWVMVQYSLDGAASEALDDDRENDLMMRFDASNKVLATASCHVTDGAIVNADLGDGGCKTNTSKAEWYCQCFAYTYESDEMVWQEFDAGSEPPDEIIDPDDGGDGDTGTGGGGDSIRVYVQEADGSQDKIWGPLPMDLWESDGLASRYTFRQKSPSIWDNPEYGTSAPVLPGDCASACSLEVD